MIGPCHDDATQKTGKATAPPLRWDKLSLIQTTYFNTS